MDFCQPTIERERERVAELTEDSEAEVESDDHGVGVGGENAAVIEVAGSPREALAMHEHQDWIGRSPRLL